MGDTKQLSATLLSPANQQGNVRSLLWRCIEQSKLSHHMLTIQYRMDPEISAWPSKQYYDGNLQDAPCIKTRPSPFTLTTSPLQGPYHIIDVKGQESRFGNSYANGAEVEVIQHLINHLTQHCDVDAARDIGVISFYSGQVRRLQQQLGNKVRVQTVDGFQGDENNIIIISCVRSNGNGNIGFVEDFRRLNVAITRARFGLYIVGNADTLAESKSDCAKLIEDAEKRKLLLSADTIMPARATTSSNATTNHTPQKNPKKRRRPEPSNNSSRVQTRNDVKRPRKYTIRCYNFFKKGHCHSGNNCDYSHNKAESSYRQPPSQR